MVVAYGNQSFLNAGRERTNPQYLNYFTTLLLLTILYKGRLLASRQVSVSECSVEWENVGHRYEFAQRDCFLRAYTAREDNILPYSGWVVIRTAKFQFPDMRCGARKFCPAKLQFVSLLSKADMLISEYAPLRQNVPDT